MPKFPSRKEASVLDFLPNSGASVFRERLMARGRQSQNVLDRRERPVLGLGEYLVQYAGKIREFYREDFQDPPPAVLDAMNRAAATDRARLQGLGNAEVDQVFARSGRWATGQSGRRPHRLSPEEQERQREITERVQSSTRQQPRPLVSSEPTEVDMLSWMIFTKAMTPKRP